MPTAEDNPAELACPEPACGEPCLWCPERSDDQPKGEATCRTISGIRNPFSAIPHIIAIKALKEAHARTHPAHKRMKLEETRNTVMLNIMNAAEIIREIARLPDTEQGKIVEFVEALKSTKQVRYIDSAVVEKTADKVFREHAPLFEKLAQ